VFCNCDGFFVGSLNCDVSGSLYTFFCITVFVCDVERTREVGSLCFEVGSLCLEVGWIVGRVLGPCVYLCSLVVC
jgi:hypothetical protein